MSVWSSRLEETYSSGSENSACFSRFVINLFKSESILERMPIGTGISSLAKRAVRYSESESLRPEISRESRSLL